MFADDIKPKIDTGLVRAPGKPPTTPKAREIPPLTPKRKTEDLDLGKVKMNHRKIF